MTLTPCQFHMIAGAVGGLIGEIGRNGSLVVLPQLTRTKKNQLAIDPGFLAGLLIGGFVGYIADHNPVVSGIAGYIGIKFIDYLVHQLFPEYVENRKVKGERADSINEEDWKGGAKK